MHQRREARPPEFNARVGRGAHADHLRSRQLCTRALRTEKCVSGAHGRGPSVTWRWPINLLHPRVAPLIRSDACHAAQQIMTVPALCPRRIRVLPSILRTLGAHWEAHVFRHSPGLAMAERASKAPCSDAAMTLSVPCPVPSAVCNSKAVWLGTDLALPVQSAPHRRCAHTQPWRSQCTPQG